MPLVVLAGIQQRASRNTRRVRIPRQLEHDMNVVGGGRAELQPQRRLVVVAQMSYGELIEISLQVLEQFQEGEEQDQMRRPVRPRVQNSFELRGGQHLAGAGGGI